MDRLISYEILIILDIRVLKMKAVTETYLGYHKILTINIQNYEQKFEILPFYIF